MLAGNMSCVDVMYPPYASYFSYQRPSASSAADTFKKYGSVKMHESLEAVGPYGAAAMTAVAAAAAVSQHSVSATITKLEDPEAGSPHGPGPHGPGPGAGPHGKELAASPHNAQYLSTNCVLFTYYAGDVASNVDEHFSRALSQPSSFTGGDGPNSPHSPKSASSWKDPSPMSQRNFPASFWNSSYQPSGPPPGPPPGPPLGPPDPLGSLHGPHTDPYVTSSLHSMSSLGTDPWRYPLTSQPPHTYTHSHHGMHDMAYAATMASTARFQPAHYSSLLGSARLGTVTAQCDLGKHGPDGWSGRYHGDPLGANLAAAHDAGHLHTAAGISAGGIDAAVQDPSKDLYWF